MASLLQEHPSFQGVDGKPLVGGKVFIGTQNQDPTAGYPDAPVNLITIYAERALTTPIANPQTIDSYGRSTNKIWIPEEYSMVVWDANDVQTYINLDVGGSLRTDLALSSGSSLVGFLPAGTGAVATTVQSKLRESVSVQDFGAVGDGVTDDTAAINAASATGITEMPAGAYKVNGNLTLVNAIRCSNGVAVLDFDGVTGALITDNSPQEIKGILIDGTNCTSVSEAYSFDIDNTGDYAKRIDLTVRDISNTDNTEPCRGILVFQSSGGTETNKKVVIKGDVKNITATANSIVGDTPGSATGIKVSINKTGTNHTIEINEPYVENVGPIEDGDGIIMGTADGATINARGSYQIIGGNVKGCAKRQIKIQAQNCIVSNTILDNYISSSLSGSLAISVYAANCALDNITVIDQGTTSEPDLIECANAVNLKIVNPTVITSNKSKAIRLNDCADFTVTGGNIYCSGTLSSVDSGQIYIEGDTNGKIDGTLINNTTSTGSGVRFLGTTTGKITLNGVEVVNSKEAIRVSNANALDLKLNDCELVATQNVVSATASGDVSIKGGSLKSTGDFAGFKAITSIGDFIIKGVTVDAYHGILSEFDNAVVESNTVRANTANTGTGIAVKSESIVANNKLHDFSTGLQYTFSTNVKSAANLFVSCVTDELATGSSGTITYDNATY